MANKEKGNFKVTTNSGKEVSVQQIKNSGERWYQAQGSGVTYSTKQEIKDCEILNSKK